MTHRAKQSQRGGVGIISLIVVAIIVIVVVAVFVLPRLSRRRGPHTGFATCQANLKGIGTAILAYEDAYDSLPLIKPYEAVHNGANSAPTEANQIKEPFSSGRWESTLGDQAMQNVWLLIEGKYVYNEGIFHCYADRSFEPRKLEAEQRYGYPRPRDYGWTDPHQYSYGMQWPYHTDAAGNTNPAPLLTPNTGLMADRNPGGPLGESRPPSDHPKHGTNLLLASGGVKASYTMVSTIGTGGDDIYTNAAGVAGGLPQHDEDTSITLSGR